LRSPSSNSFRGRFFVGAVGASVGFGDFAMQPSDNEEAKWRAEFEKLGRETVRIAIYRRQGFSPDRKRELALLWLQEKEAAT
jgi:hypothetical protein